MGGRRRVNYRHNISCAESRGNQGMDCNSYQHDQNDQCEPKTYDQRFSASAAVAKQIHPDDQCEYGTCQKPQANAMKTHESL